MDQDSLTALPLYCVMLSVCCLAAIWECLLPALRLIASCFKKYVTHRWDCDWSDSPFLYLIWSRNADVTDISPCYFAESSVTIRQLFLGLKIYSLHFNLFKIKDVQVTQRNPMRSKQSSNRSSVRVGGDMMAAVSQVTIWFSLWVYTCVTYRLSHNSMAALFMVTQSRPEIV